MKVLLDTHALLWAAASPERLASQQDLVADPATELLVSAATSWEIAIKHELGKLPLPEPPSSYVPATIRRLAAVGLPVEHSHALAVAALPPHHRDPFDRLLVALAQLLDVPILTADSAFDAYEVRVLSP